MAGSGYSVTITAVDRASTQIDAINKRIAAARAPVDRMQRSLARLADNTGMSAVAGGMRNFASASLQAFENVGRMAPALGAITSVATVAGLARLTETWGEFGQRLAYSSQRIGVSTDRLQALQGAARLAGASAEGLTSGMQSLRDNLVNAAAGRAPQVITMMNMLGISLRDSRGNIRGVTDVLPELAEKIARIKDPTRQAIVAQEMLGGAAEDLLPFLRRGAAGIADLSDQARRYGVVNEASAQRAIAFRQSVTRVQLAAEGLANTLGDDLAQSFGPVLEGTAAWIAQNKDLIASDVSKWASDYAAIIRPIAKEIDGIVTGTIGWNRALEIAVPLITAQMIPGVKGLEKWLAKIAALRVAPWLLRLLGVAGAGAAAGAITLLTPNTSIQSDADESAALRAAIANMGERANNGLFMPHMFSPPVVFPSGVALSRGVYGQGVGQRDHNPLNLRYAPGQPLVVGGDHGFGVYRSDADGIAAATRQLLLYQNRDHLNTIRGIVSRWAPSSENDTAGYIKAVASRLGVSPDQPVDLRDQRVMSTLITAMARQESNFRDQVAIRRGVHMGLGEPAPVGLPAPVHYGVDAPGVTAPPVVINQPAAASGQVTGTASVHIRVEAEKGFRTRTSATTDGNLFSGPAHVGGAMPTQAMP